MTELISTGPDHAIRSAARRRPAGALGIARRAVLGAWISLAVLTAWLWWEFRAGAVHFHYGLTLLALAGLAVCGAAGIVAALIVVCAGPKRGAAAAALIATLLPLALAAWPGIYAQVEWAERRVPNNFLMRMATLAGASLMEAQAEWFYPRRLNSPRIAMFYRELADPHGELAAMEQHVAKLESQLGKPLQARIWWVRGALLGQSRLSMYGLALGSSGLPETANLVGGLDRHELAHAVMHQAAEPGSVPPTLLGEGWAEANALKSSDELAADAVVARALGAPSVATLLNEDWYRQDSGPVYSVGGAWVDFLLRRDGHAKFLSWYTNATPANVTADFRAIYAVDLAEVEVQFWREVEQLAKTAGPAPPPPVAPLVDPSSDGIGAANQSNAPQSP